MDGLDVILAGHLAQAQPIGDDSLCKEGAYVAKAGKGLNKPPKGREDEGAPSVADFSNSGQLFMDEFLGSGGDVVYLRECHRLDEAGEPGWSDSRVAKYKADARRFKDVLDRMADLEWTREDRDWLAQRSLGSLLSTPEGRETYEREFKDAPILMDGKKTNRHGDDGADQYNEQ